MTCIPRSFFDRPATIVARELLGAHLVRVVGGQHIIARIVEAEAYQGEEDLGCHAHAGKTKRNAVMYGPPGHAYVYFTYGMHWMLNAVTGAVDHPAAVLIRAIQPLEGFDLLVANRPNLANTCHWLDGPAKLTQALAIGGDLNGVDLCDPRSELHLTPGVAIPPREIHSSARIGLYTVPEPWKSIPWRFYYASPPDDEKSK
jgi:DNA-3-methyladenine glycosylase